MSDHDTSDDVPDAGAYIGRKPEFSAETIPGGVRDDDERVAATQSQSSGEGAAAGRTEQAGAGGPRGHRQGEPASDETVREAGENR